MRNQYIAGLRDVMRVSNTDGVPFTKEAKQQARYLGMRRGLRYLLEYTLVHARSGLTTAQSMETAHHLTRPELLRDPALGRKEMERLSDQHVALSTVQEIYAFASDVFHYGEKGDAGALARFLWETPRTQLLVARELISLLTPPSNSTTSRTLVEIDEHIQRAIEMLGVQPPTPAEEQDEALVAAGVDDDWMADWMKDPDEGER